MATSMTASYEKYTEIRDEKGITDYRVAHDIGFAESIIYDWRHGKSHPGVGRLHDIARYLGVPMERLLA